MSSELKLSLEWCVELPLPDAPRISPVFMLNGDEWFFKFVLHKWKRIWYYELFVELQKKRSELLPCKCKFEVMLKNEEALLRNGEFLLTPVNQVIWYTAAHHVWSKHSSDSKGICLKFLFQFEDSSFRFARKTDEKSTQTSSYIDTNVALGDLSKDFAKLFLAGPDHDIHFKCDDENIIKAHKNVLSCRSDVFATMFQTDKAEIENGQVKVMGVQSYFFWQFLMYLYTGLVPEFTVDAALQLYEIADKYSVHSLKKQCVNFLLENASAKNACEILMVADRHNDLEFRNMIISCVVENNGSSVVEKLNHLSADNSALAAETSGLSVNSFMKCEILGAILDKKN